MPRLDISGVFVPTATPFDAAGEVDLAAFRSNCRRWLSHGISGLVVGGSTGEALLLDEDERVALWSAAREELDDRLLIAGTGAESTRASIRLARAAADAGADALLVQPPAFFRGAMSNAALTRHFDALAEASPVGYRELATSKLLEGRCWTTPVLLGGRVYARNSAGHLVCAELPKDRGGGR